MAGGGHEHQVVVEEACLGQTSQRQQAGNAGAAFAGVHMPAGDGRGDDDAAALAAVEPADYVAARHGLAVLAVDLQRQRLAAGLGRVEQCAVLGRHQHHGHWPRHIALADVVGVDLGTGVVDGQQHRGRLAREGGLQGLAVVVVEVGAAVKGDVQTQERARGRSVSRPGCGGCRRGRCPVAEHRRTQPHAGRGQRHPPLRQHVQHLAAHAQLGFVHLVLSVHGETLRADLQAGGAQLLCDPVQRLLCAGRAVAVDAQTLVVLHVGKQARTALRRQRFRHGAATGQRPGRGHGQRGGGDQTQGHGVGLRESLWL